MAESMSLAKPTPPLHTFEATSSDLAKNVSRQPPESEHSLPGKQAGNQLVTSDHRPNKGVILSEDESYCSDETVENEPTDPEWNGSSDGEDDTSDDDNQSQRMIQKNMQPVRRSSRRKQPPEKLRLTRGQASRDHQYQSIVNAAVTCARHVSQMTSPQDGPPLKAPIIIDSPIQKQPKNTMIARPLKENVLGVQLNAPSTTNIIDNGLPLPLPTQMKVHRPQWPTFQFLDHIQHGLPVPDLNRFNSVIAAGRPPNLAAAGDRAAIPRGEPSRHIVRPLLLPPVPPLTKLAVSGEKYHAGEANLPPFRNVFTPWDLRPYPKSPPTAPSKWRPLPTVDQPLPRGRPGPKFEPWAARMELDPPSTLPSQLDKPMPVGLDGETQSWSMCGAERGEGKGRAGSNKVGLRNDDMFPR